jgi:hypothetical protein
VKIATQKFYKIERREGRLFFACTACTYALDVAIEFPGRCHPNARTQAAAVLKKHALTCHRALSSQLSAIS